MKRYLKNIEMANEHMKGCSASPAIREMKIKTSMNYYYILIKTATISNSDNTKCCPGYGSTGFHTYSQEYKMIQPFWKTV